MLRTSPSRRSTSTTLSWLGHSRDGIWYWTTRCTNCGPIPRKILATSCNIVARFVDYQPVSPSKQRSAFSTLEPNYGTIMSSLSKAEIPVVQKFPPLLKLSASRSKQSRPRRLQIETAPARFLLAPFQDIQLTFSKKVHHPLSPHLVLENNWIPKDKTAKQNWQKDSTIPMSAASNAGRS